MNRLILLFGLIVGLPATAANQPDTSPPPEIAVMETPNPQAVEASFDDWSLICTADETGDKVCQIVQSVNQNDSGQLVFQTAVGYVPDNESPILYMTAPLGIFLPRGISIFVDDDEEGRTAQVLRCTENGCLAVLAMQPELVQKLKKGNEGRLIFGATAQQNVAIPLSLTGFTRAFDALTPSSTP